MDFDLIVRGGEVLTGEPGDELQRLDVGVVNGEIHQIADLRSASAETIVDASSRVVAPGFVDVHTHAEISSLGGPHQYAPALQGVTTQLSAPDGFGWTHLDEFHAQQLWETTSFSTGPAPFPVRFPTAESYLSIFPGRLPTNLIPQVPHCAVHASVVGWTRRMANDQDLKQMRRLVAEWMDAGAVGLCLGMDYQPSALASTQELIELCREVARYRGLCAAHIRYSALGREGAWREALKICREAPIPFHVSHEVVDDVSAPFLETEDDVTFESYLYPASCTHLALTLPVWAQEGGSAGIRERLSDWAYRLELEKVFDDYHKNERQAGRHLVFAHTQSGRYIGQTFGEVALAEGMSPGQLCVKMLGEEHPFALMIYHKGYSSELWTQIQERTIKHPRMMVASDAIYTGHFGHPRGYGCFPKVLRECVRERQHVTLAEAVYRMAGFPATRFRVPRRGYLRKSYAADIVVFDPRTVADRATFETPREKPSGIDYVIVNGRIVVDQGHATSELPGSVLARL